MKKIIITLFLLSFCLTTITQAQSVYCCDICNRKITNKEISQTVMFLSREADCSIMHKICYYKIKDLAQNTETQINEAIDKANKKLLYKMQKGEAYAKMIKAVKKTCLKKYHKNNILDFAIKKGENALKQLFEIIGLKEFAKYNNNIIIYNSLLKEKD